MTLFCTVTKGRGLLAVLANPSAAGDIDIRRGAIATVTREGREVHKGFILTVDRDAGAITVLGYAPEDGDLVAISHAIERTE